MGFFDEIKKAAEQAVTEGSKGLKQLETEARKFDTKKFVGDLDDAGKQITKGAGGFCEQVAAKGGEYVNEFQKGVEKSKMEREATRPDDVSPPQATGGQPGAQPK